MQRLRILTAVFLVAGCVVAQSHGAVAASPRPEARDYVHEPLPPGFQVLGTELEGPVFADARGRTIYRWPRRSLRNADAGEVAGKPACYNERVRETAGLINIYPAGDLLPEADTRPTCTEHWPPVAAAADAEPVGNFTILERTDGIRQWAYKGFALYTSHLDQLPGETRGGRSRYGRDVVSGGAQRVPVTPEPAVPAQFKVANMELGRMLATARNMSVYAYEKDKPNQSNCYDACLTDWTPVFAPELSVPLGDWSVIARRDGKKQWAYKGQPLYTYVLDTKNYSYFGGDVPGWRNVYMQLAPNPPKGFGVVDTHAGQVRTEFSGKAIYYYQCVEDTLDTTFCDTPESPQVYRFAMCGGGDPELCLKNFPYVLADKNAKSENLTWGVKDIDPMTGRYVAAGTPGSLHIWTFRGRPIYTFAGDRNPGDIEADTWGQDHGQANGYTAFYVRDDFETLDMGKFGNN